MIETLVAAAFLTPLFLGIWYIAALQNLTLAGLEATRFGFVGFYAADRHVALPDLHEFVTSNDPGSHSLSYEAAFDLTDDARMPAIERVQSVTATLLAPVQVLSTQRFDVPDATPRRLNARLLIDPAGWSGLGSLVPPLTIEAPVAVLVGVAASSGRAETLNRLGAFSVSQPFETLVRPVTILRPALELLEPAFRRFCPGRLEPDIVPVDRLPSSVVVQNDLRTRPCT